MLVSDVFLWLCFESGNGQENVVISHLRNMVSNIFPTYHCRNTITTSLIKDCCHSDNIIIYLEFPNQKDSPLLTQSHRHDKWWRHQMETFSTLLAICAGNSPINGEFSAQRPVTRGFDVLFDLRLNERLCKQPWGRWFETPSRPLWRHSNEIIVIGRITNIVFIK